jgi:hypothetical protein
MCCLRGTKKKTRDKLRSELEELRLTELQSAPNAVGDTVRSWLGSFTVHPRSAEELSVPGNIASCPNSDITPQIYFMSVEKNMQFGILIRPAKKTLHDVKAVIYKCREDNYFSDMTG